MKKLKDNQQHGCSFCLENGVKTQAAWRSNGFGITSKFACDPHRDDLRTYEENENRRNDHYSEADYQTWMRL